MTAHGFLLFDTAIGRCGIAWGARGVALLQLPEGREEGTRARLLQRMPGALEAPPPPDVQRAIDGIAALLRGEASDLSGVALDMERVPPFHRRVYEVARTIPPGATLTYGDIAARLGSIGSARAVGQALGRNPFAILVPCHRVLAAGGKVGGFSADGGVTTKLRLLEIERARPAGAPRADGGAAGAPRADGGGAFGFDPAAAVERLRASDAALGRLIDRVGPFGMRLDRTSSLFLALAESIVYQQLTGKAAATIFARARALFPRAHESFTPEQLLRASDEELRAAGLSRAKLLSLRDLARRTQDGELPTLAEVHGMEDEAIVERLTQVRGIGRWTAEMLLMFRLGRPDVLPVDDYGIRKGFAIAFKQRELPGRKDLERRGARWRPYRTVASWYLWRAVDLARGDGPRAPAADGAPRDRA
ncbi:MULTISPECIES: methylated-DNA--[protein]-cysteine S-methyltransferase [Sorangium]|uniref:DNA-3-methyladenine glycosylase II n=1 Tax=Sorangium cellulosum TaxID=56 RepID=A0A4P2QIB1_SORCE|nr:MULTISPECIES: methylated-DNA--[protein]-cysteine S-methyltransferase [Sorangium]AUX29311.1 methylated-DNA--protein-cysteine methyltransferase [Sorangium cellulosum]WCQ88702.1 DNA methyltransferase [Sorangium sp. Soce836]